MVQKRSATLGDLVFGDVDPHGTAIWLSQLKGWDEGTGTTGTSEQRAADDGAWLTPAYMPPRLIEMELTLRGTSFRGVSRSISRIAAGLPLSALEVLEVDNHGDVHQALVRQAGNMLPTQKAALGRVSLSLLAPDPRRYSTDESSTSTGLPQTSGGLSLPISLPVTIGATVSSGVLVAVNAGDVATPVRFAIAGYCPPGATVTHLGTGQQLRFADEVPAGRVLEIDTAARTALMDGTASRTVTGSWFYLQPGINEISFSASAYHPDAELTCTHRSAWR